MVICLKKKNNNMKMLNKGYDYYTKVKKKTDKIAEKKYNNYDEIFKARLYNLVLNICNQYVYDYTYVFTKCDLFFIADNNINIYELINEFRNEIRKMKKNFND